MTITELQKRGGLTDEAYAAFLKRSEETHALGRPGDPEEVAKAIAFWPQRTHRFLLVLVFQLMEGYVQILNSFSVCRENNFTEKLIIFSLS